MHEPSAGDQLIGKWASDPEDSAAIAKYGETSIVFSGDGSLRYIVHGQSKDQIMLMTYRVEPGVLITDQPSAQREERTRFEITGDGKLVLRFGGVRSQYVRVG